ncbi:MAG: hypothetical protein K2H82_05615 [Oscillospiraceae bacterium]|nr:hypothetical protein [Oscillospiraceae bacterium]
MKNFSFKKALAAVAAISVVSCAALPFVSLEASAADGFEIRIDKKAVTLTELAGTNYKVPIYVRMNEGHPGLNAMECGFSVDSRCQYEVINSPRKAMAIGGEMVHINVTYASNTYGGENITWMAWASDQDDDTLTNIALIMVDVPKNAKKGDRYDIKYRSSGINPKNPAKASPHLFKNKAGTDYVAAGAVKGFDGWILISG